MLGDQERRGSKVPVPRCSRVPPPPTLLHAHAHRTHKFSYIFSTWELMTNNIMHAHFPHTFFSSLYVSDTHVDANKHAVPSLSLSLLLNIRPPPPTHDTFTYLHTHTRPFFTGTVCPVNVRSQQTVFLLISPLDLNKALSLIHCCLGTQ